VTIRNPGYEPSDMGQLTPSFHVAEWRCRDGTDVPAEWYSRVRELAEQLEELRAELGDRGIRIISGYRTPEYNKRIHGAPKSQHLQCRAADIRVVGVAPWQVAKTIETLIKAGRMKQGGLGEYASFVHYDTRGIRARWKGRGV